MTEQDLRRKLDFAGLAPEVTRAFADHGVVCIRQLINQNEVDMLREWIEVAIKNPNPRFAGQFNRTYIVDNHLWPKWEGFRRIAFDSRIAEAAATVMGSKEVRMYNDSMFVKEPSAPEPTPWHQDLPYFRVDGPNTSSAWIALDPANEASGAMTYAVGSHRWGKLFRPIEFAKPENAYAEDGFDGPPPDPDLNPDLGPTVGFDVKPGDVVFHNLLTLHKAGPNTSTGVRRRVHTIRFAGDHSVWRKRPISSFEFKSTLADGEPLEGDEFPVLWPRA